MNQVEATDVSADTSFLDAYREKGPQGLAEAKARRADEDLAAMESELAKPETDTCGSGELEHQDIPTAQRGGSASGPTPAGEAASGESVPAEIDDVAEPAALDDPELDAPEAAPAAEPVLEPEAEDQVPTSLQKTDHQEAVQAAASAPAKGGSGGADLLPNSGFRLSGSKPHIRALPEEIITVLREQLRSAAVRELGVSDQAARDFSERLSQGTLVTGFLLAQLDLRMDADPATMRAAELFRSRDPLLGSVVSRMEELEHTGQRHEVTLGTLRDELRQVRQTAAVIEQAVAYFIADRTENFLRGQHDIREAPITHRSSLFVRDKIREETQKQQRIERDREGRPIR